MPHFCKKPVVIEAIQYNGKNLNEIRDFLGYYAKIVDRRIQVKTMEGIIYAKETDFIIKGVANEFYPCDEQVFAATHDLVSPETPLSETDYILLDVWTQFAFERQGGLFAGGLSTLESVQYYLTERRLLDSSGNSKKIDAERLK